MIETTCRYCGIEFTAIRISKLFCSDSCKTKAYLKRRREEKETNVHKGNDQSAFLQNDEQISAKPVPKTEFFETSITNIKADSCANSGPRKRLKRGRVRKRESISISEVAFRLLLASIQKG